MASYAKENTENNIFIIRTANVENYTDYVIEVRIGGYHWHVNHRYSEFFELNEQLVAEHGIDKKLLPPKKAFGNSSASFIQKRRSGLERYLQLLIKQFERIPFELAAFLEFPKYEINGVTQILAETLFSRGDALLEKESTCSMDPLQLHAITERHTKPDTVVSSHTRDIGHILDFITRLNKLRVISTDKLVGTSNINMNNLEYNLAMFKNIQYLELVKCNIKRINGLDHIRKNVEKLKVKKSLTSLQEFLTHNVIYWEEEDSAGDDSRPNIAWPNLTWVDMSENNITELPEAMRCLERMEYLDLHDNYLETIENLEAVSYLTHLDVSINRIERLSDLHLKLGNVKSINLSGNKLETLEAFNKLYSLEYLDVSNNQISQVLELKCLGSLPLLDALVITGNPVTVIPDYRIQVLKIFGTRAKEVTLDNKKGSPKELDTISILLALDSGNQPANPRKESETEKSVAAIAAPAATSSGAVVSAEVVLTPTESETKDGEENSHQLSAPKLQEKLQVLKQKVDSQRPNKFDETVVQTGVTALRFDSPFNSPTRSSAESEQQFHSLSSTPEPTEPTVIAGTDTEPTEPTVIAGTVTEPTEPTVIAGTVTEPTEPAVIAGTVTEPTEPTVIAGTVTEPTEPAMIAGTLNNNNSADVQPPSDSRTPPDGAANTSETDGTANIAETDGTATDVHQQGDARTGNGPQDSEIAQPDVNIKNTDTEGNFDSRADIIHNGDTEVNNDEDRNDESVVSSPSESFSVNTSEDETDSGPELPEASLPGVKPSSNPSPPLTIDTQTQVVKSGEGVVSPTSPVNVSIDVVDHLGQCLAKVPNTLKLEHPLDRLTKMDGEELLNLFYHDSVIRRIGDSKEELCHAMWTSLVTYNNPDVEQQCLVLLSNQATYFVRPGKDHGKYTTRSITHQNLKEVYVGPRNQSLRLGGETDNDYYCCVTREPQLVHIFVTRIAFIVDTDFAKPKPEVQSSGSESEEESIYDIGKTEEPDHPSGVRFVYGEDNSLEEMNSFLTGCGANITELQFVDKYFVHLSAADAEDLHPCTVALTNHTLYLVQEAYANLPLPQSTLQPPNCQNYSLERSIILSDITDLAFNDKHLQVEVRIAKERLILNFCSLVLAESFHSKLISVSP